MSTHKFSVIICSIDAGKFSRVSECYKTLLAQHSFEIIGIHDARSLAEAYNRGIRESDGEIIIFSHDDVLILDRCFATKVVERLASFDLIGFAGASRLVNATWFGAGPPHLHGAVCHAPPKSRKLNLNIWGTLPWPIVPKIKALDGLCMVATRDVAETIGFDADTFDGFHLYDIDFSFSAYLANYRLGVICDVPIIHESGGNFDATHNEFALRFLGKHGANLDAGTAVFPRETSGSRISVGRGAALMNTEALQRIWCRDVFTRTTLALQKTLSPHAPFVAQSDWWKKYLAT